MLGNMHAQIDEPTLSFAFSRTHNLPLADFPRLHPSCKSPCDPRLNLAQNRRNEYSVRVRTRRRRVLSEETLDHPYLSRCTQDCPGGIHARSMMHNAVFRPNTFRRLLGSWPLIV
jgi:hypothetical protein